MHWISQVWSLLSPSDCCFAWPEEYTITGTTSLHMARRQNRIGDPGKSHGGFVNSVPL